MPTPANAPAGSVTAGAPQHEDNELFASLTERQELPQQNQAFVGFGEDQALELQRVGVIAKARLEINVLLKVGVTAVAHINPGFPQKLLRKISIESNGVTGIISASGQAIEARRRRIYRNPVHSVDSGPVGGEELAAGSEHWVKMTVLVPIAHDMLSLNGALLAQTIEESLAINLEWAKASECFHGEAVTIKEGTVRWATTVFSVGSAPIQTGNGGTQMMTILPDLSLFHGLIEKEVRLKGTGEEPALMSRASGRLICYGARVQNGDEAEIDPATWEAFAIEYGANRDPRKWRPASLLVADNADDYDGAIDVNGLHTLFVDNEIDDPDRDVIFPTALTELRGVVTLAAGTALNANAAIVWTQESLYPSKRS